MRRRAVVNGLGTVVAGLAVLPLSPVWANWSEGEYRIQQAFYGTAERHVDVTQRLRELARNDERFILRNETFGVDPHKGQTKTLRIIASGPGGRTRIFEYTEGSAVDGSQFSGWGAGNWGQDNGRPGQWGDKPGFHDGGDAGFRILRAQYGTAERNIDVTQQLRDLARRDERFRLRNETFGSDPDRGRPKVLRIYARGPNGQSRTFEYPEGSWVDGSQFSGWGGGDWGQDGGSQDWGGDRPGFGGSGGSGSHNNDNDLYILSAEYGAGRDRVDITARLQERVVNGRLSFKVSNAVAGGDPANGRPKQLSVSYRLNGRERRRVWSEGDYLSIP